MDIFGRLMDTQFAGIATWRIGMFFLTLFLALLAGKIAKIFFKRGAKKFFERNRTMISAALEAVAASIGFFTFTFGMDIGIRFLSISPYLAATADSAVKVLYIVSFAWAAYRMVDVVDRGLHNIAEKTASKMDDMLAPLVRKSLRVTIVVLALTQIATSLSDKPVTSLLAGLGVGGLAVALAAQDTLKNFFGSLVIFSDKPFDMGDRIIVDGHDGTVAEVGFRSTRIRTLEGNLVTIPNGELANKTILNIGKRPHIRRILNIALVYSTPPEKISRALEIIKGLLENHEGMNPDFPPRVYFDNFKDFSLNIFVIYWYHPPNYWDYMAFSEKLNLEILRRFNEEGIEFAFPTRTVHVSRKDE
jgi:MscS family membrane protein